MKRYRDCFRNTFIALLGGAMLFASCKKDDPKSAACDIVMFSIDAMRWDLNEVNNTFSHTYPSETTEGMLIPTISLSAGASVSPASGVAQNFFTADGVTYTVTAEDGVTKKTYVAKATRTKYSVCDIVSFSVDGEDWDIEGTQITHVYPRETAERQLTPVITLLQGATVDPPSGAAQNLFAAQGVTYTVTAEDGTKKAYTVRAKRELHTECDMTSFSVNGEDWEINGGLITHAYPKGTPETPLTPVITLSEGASVNPPASGAHNFFTEQGVTYIVTAEDGTTRKAYIAKARIQDPWEYSSNTLTILDNDAMVNYTVTENGISDAPWFQYKNNIQTLVINSGVSTIGNNSFYDFKNLTSVTIPYSVTAIGYGAFRSCQSLPSVAIPSTVTSIGDYAFYDCISFSGTIPSSVRTIGMAAFIYCHGIISLTIPDGVTTIEEWTFFNCQGLTSVNLPASLTTIKDRAFGTCDKLREVTNYNPNPQEINDLTFAFVNLKNITLKVPSGSVEAYKAANVWKDFGTITGI
jgi:hypothetical protein